MAALAIAKKVYFADAKKLGLLTILQNYPIQCFPIVPLGIMKIHEKIMQPISSMNKVKQAIFSFFCLFSCFFRRDLNLNIGKILFPSIHQALGFHLEYILTGGATLNSNIAQDFYSWGYNIIEGYGLTETAGVITTTEGDFSTIGSCGKTLPGVTIIIDKPNKDGCGEVLIKSSRLMAGYFRDPEANQQVYLDGVLRTGDLGKVDDKGYLFIMGRIKEIIIHSDERKTLPQDIEVRYQQLDGIEKLAVVGITDNMTKCDVIHAAIVPKQELVQKYQGDMIQVKNILKIKFLKIS